MELYILYTHIWIKGGKEERKGIDNVGMGIDKSWHEKAEESLTYKHKNTAYMQTISYQ